MERKSIVYTPAMAEALLKYQPQVRGLLMMALQRYFFDGKYAEKKPEWCREWLELAEREQKPYEIRQKKRRELKEAEYRQILAYLNQTTGRDFRLTDRFRGLVDARIREGAKVEDFMAVVDNMAAAWSADPKMRMYLRPETLFGGRFDGYRTAASGGFAGSSFETDDFAEAAMQASYGDEFDLLFGGK